MIRTFKLQRGFYVLLLIPCVGYVSREQKPLHYPLSCAGIRVGHTTDEEVTKMYGPGLFVKNEDHCGGRYYVDTRRNVMLHVRLGTDKIIDFIQYQRGVCLPHSASSAELKRATTSHLTATNKLKDNIGLGDSAPRMLQAYGKPQQETWMGRYKTLRYKTDYKDGASLIFYQSEFRFLGNCLVSVKLYTGDL